MVGKTIENMNKLYYFHMMHNQEFVTGVANLRKLLAKLGLKPKTESSVETEYEKW